MDQPACRLLPERLIVRMTGGDRVRFLDGMVSNDVAGLSDGQALPALQLDRKGHVLAELTVVALARELLLDVDAGRGGAVYDLLEKHLVADDVELERREDWLHAGFEGPGAAAAAGVPELAPGTASLDGELIWLAGGDLDPDGVRLLGPAAAVEACVARSGLPRLGDEQAEILRVELLQPRFDRDYGERSFPAEAQLEHAVCYDKGCYLGQEIVARIHARGAVNRLLVQLRADGPVAAGDAILVRGRASGEVTSAVLSPTRGALALGTIKRDHARPGTVVAIGGVAAVVAGPPLDESS